MKKILILALALIPLFSYGQKKSDSSIEYFVSVTFEKIEDPGKLYLIWKDGDSKIDTNYTVGMNKTSFSGDITFKKARINLIEFCHYKLTMNSDTILSVEVKTFSETNTKQLIEQAKLQYGEPFMSYEKKNSIYSWKKNIENKGTFDYTLTHISNGKKAVLSIKPEKKTE
jgi:hypothetical protein